MKKSKNKEDYWFKFYECACHGEGIMMSYEYEEEGGLPQIDMAFFQYGNVGRHPLGFRERLRWAWNLIRTGRPFLDEVMLSQRTARELADDLLKFSKKKYTVGRKK